MTEYEGDSVTEYTYVATKRYYQVLTSRHPTIALASFPRNGLVPKLSLNPGEK